MNLPALTRLLPAAVTAFCLAPAHSQTVFTGFDVFFERPNSQADTGPVDQLTDNVALARGFNMGLFNDAVEDFFIRDNGQPTGTRWATVLDNPDQTIAADNFANLTFTDWVDAYSAPGANLLSNITSIPAVLHLVEDDIYLDIQFTSWTSSGGGGFAYNRSILTAVVDPGGGDFDGDGFVTIDDYATWLGQFGQTGEGLSADANSDNLVDAADYTLWRDALGSSVAAAPVPSPGGVELLLALVFGVAAPRNRRVG